ncbi:MAG: IS481 family transposase, partial [Syntrophobacteria bacterium]
ALPKENEPPKQPLQKPISGRYHLVRYIRSTLQLNVFGEIFSVPPELQHEYVVATIDVKEQKLQLFLNHKKVHEYKYTLR